MIQHSIPLQMMNPTIGLKPGSLNGRPPHEILIVEVIHGIVEVGVTLPIQTVNDMGVPGVGVDNIGARVRVPPLVGTRDGHFTNAIGVLGEARHGNDKMVR